MTTTICSFGSAQNTVPYAPFQVKSPTLPLIAERPRSIRTATPKPNPYPTRPGSVRPTLFLISLFRWFDAINATV